MPTKTIPLGGSVGARFVNTTISPQLGTQLLNNIIPIDYTDEEGNRFRKLYSRPGFSSQIVNTVATYHITRGVLWTGVTPTTLAAPGVLVYAEHNGTDVRLYQWDSAATLLGTYAAAYECVGIQETIISNVANLTLNMRLLAAPYTQTALFFPTGGALTQIVDADFPTNNIGPFAHMDGFAFIMDLNGNIWNSDINSLSAWTATSFTGSTSAPGGGIGVYKIKTYIVGFRSNSIDFYENTGNAAGSPLTRIPQAAISLGAIHSGSILQVGDEIYFIGRSTPGKFGVYVLSGFTAKKISTAALDAILRNLLISNTTETAIRGGSYAVIPTGSRMIGAASMHGQTIVFLAIAQAQTMGSVPQNVYGYVVGIDDPTWLQFTYASIPTVGPQAIFGAGASTFCICPNEGITAAYTSTSNDLLQDFVSSSTQPFGWSIYSHKITRGTGRRKYCRRLQFISDKEVVSVGTAFATVAYSDDDGANFTTLGTVDLARDSPSMGPGGAYVQRIWQMYSTASAPCLLDRVEETYDIGPI